MKHINKTVIAFILTFMACTERIEIKTDNSEPVIVIYGILTDEFKHQEVMVSRSSPYFDNEPNAGISGATVSIQSSNNETYLLSENDTVQGLYYSEYKFRAQAGVSYLLSVEVDFDHDGIPDKYEASTTILPELTPDSLTIDSLTFFGRKNYLLYAHFQDPPEENYYLFHILYNDSLLTNDISEHIVTNDMLFNGQYTKGDLYRFSDVSNWNKDSEEEREHSVYLKAGDKLRVETGLISKGYFDFIEQCRREQNGENPMFGGPASNITTNISNGGVGYFSGYCSRRKEILFEPANKDTP